MMRHGTSDLRAAYRRVPTSQEEYTCVAVWRDAPASEAAAPHADGEVVYCLLPGHPFGLTSSVVNFNRAPELFIAAARRLLFVVCEHYVDDVDCSEPEFAGDSGQDAMVALCSNDLFGFEFDPNKHEPMDRENGYLGVETSFAQQLSHGIIEMDVSAKRRAKLAELAHAVRVAQRLPSGLAASIFGKARFMLSPCFGSIGKACLQPIAAREYQTHTSELTPELEDSLEFIEFVADHLPAARLPVLADESAPVVVFVDAEAKKRKGGAAPTGHLGFVVYHPVHGRVHGHGRVPDDIVRLLDRIKQRQTYIGQFELIGAICPFISLPPEWFAGRPVELWIDNAGAIGGLLKGYSGVPDCARIINTFHFALAKLGVTSLWIDYVPSESNPADVPSRAHELDAEAAAVLAQLGPRVPLHVPQFAGPDGDWLSFTQIARSVWAHDD